MIVLGIGQRVIISVVSMSLDVAIHHTNQTFASVSKHLTILI